MDGVVFGLSLFYDNDDDALCATGSVCILYDIRIHQFVYVCRQAKERHGKVSTVAAAVAAPTRVPHR